MKMMKRPKYFWVHIYIPNELNESAVKTTVRIEN